jgi:hypothetical protein
MQCVIYIIMAEAHRRFAVGSIHAFDRLTIDESCKRLLRRGKKLTI